MYWRKRDLWKAGTVVAGVLLLLVLMVWVPRSAASVHQETSGLATKASITVQATPTEDATVTALNKKKLMQEVEPDFFGWLRINAVILLSTLVVVIGGLIGLFRWFGDRRSEREKRAEERFQAAVTGFGNANEDAKIAAAITLRTFLRPGYEQFYIQTFDLAVANLRIPHPSKNPDIPSPLGQALIAVFKQAFPLAREWVKQGSPSSRSQRIKAWLKRTLRKEKQFDRQALQALDASSIQLDNAFLAPRIDLRGIWMREASLRKAHLNNVDLSGAYLRKTDLSGARLSGAYLSGADISLTDLSGAHLNETNLEEALSLKNTDLRGAQGLTQEQREACKARGAIIDGITT